MAIKLITKKEDNDSLLTKVFKYGNDNKGINPMIKVRITLGI